MIVAGDGPAIATLALMGSLVLLFTGVGRAACRQRRRRG